MLIQNGTKVKRYFHGFSPLASFLLLLSLSACLIPRSIVRVPELNLSFLDEDAQPLLDVRATLYWWEDPYRRLDETLLLTEPTNGKLELKEVLGSDTAAPLLIHGVRYYHHTLCLEASGYKTLIFNMIVLPRDVISLKVPLTKGESKNVCGDFESLETVSGKGRPDLLQHDAIQGVFDVDP
jgi:hypothetical protein